MISFLKNLLSKGKIIIKNSIFLKNLLSEIIYFLLNIFRKFGINIYITSVPSQRIGHLLNNIDQSVYYLDQNKTPYILLINLIGKISNDFVVSQWKKNKKIFFVNFFASKLIDYVSYNKRLEKFILGWKIIQPEFTRLYSSKKNFYIDKNEIILSKEEQEILQKEFICLHNRDQKYTRDIFPDVNYLDYKNFSFESFNSTIAQINQNNQIPVRIGNFVEKKYENKKLNYLDMSEYKSKNYMDIMLQYYSKFTIMGLTGLSNVSNTFRKPLLYINFTPINVNQLSWISQNSIIMPKLFFSTKEGRNLKFTEIFNINFDIHQQGNFLNKNNIEVIDNTENEILQAYIEMDNFINNKFHDKENYQLNKKFFDLFEDKEKSDFLLNKNNIRIPTFFLKKYYYLL
jgi:putative glycosyltransferase (TIGR04372 family)